jgi:hypothetical protein
LQVQELQHKKLSTSKSIDFNSFWGISTCPKFSNQHILPHFITKELQSIFQIILSTTTKFSPALKQQKVDLN